MAFAIEDELDIWSDTSPFTYRKTLVPRAAVAAQNQRSKKGDSSCDVESCQAIKSGTDSRKSPLRNQRCKKATKPADRDKVTDSEFISDEI
jgi:hypothetical protein